MPRINEGWRAGGLLLHPTSLPSFYGIGDLGPQAHNLARFMKKAGLHYWQMLPLTHTSPGLGNSPYSAFSAFAGNPLLISPEFMARDGWLTKDEIAAAEMPASHVVDFERVTFKKLALIESAFERAEERLKNHAGFNEFAWNNGPWMNDYAFFIAVKKYFGGRRWLDWPEDLKRRDETALRRYGADLARPIMREKFAQYLFHSQLLELRQALAYEGLGLIGDAAIYVNHDSSDVWAQQHLFHLDSA
ncbi:MAG: 4-alpha-glucanotransferase, partial [Candidatus Adiutrix sp.]|nr:4-alpha-glucanotransferase [Candidatus Adiutrix sp.]